jgi:hypothetical protein
MEKRDSIPVGTATDHGGLGLKEEVVAQLHAARHGWSAEEIQQVLG